MARRRDEDEDTLDAELEAEEHEEGAWLRVYLRKTPWWMLSVLFHGLVLGCLGLITFSKAIVFDDSPIVVHMEARGQEKLADLSAPRAIIDRDSLAKDPSETSDEVKIELPAEFVPSDRNRSDNDMDGDTLRGDSLEFLGYTPGQDGGPRGRQDNAAKGLSDVVGTGSGGGGGGFHGRPGGGSDRNTRGPGCGGPESSAVGAALRWLARHQGASGGWSAGGFAHECGGSRCSGPGIEQFDVGVTGLSVLTFLGAGYTPMSRLSYVDPVTKRRINFGQVVRRGVEFLVSQQDAQGCFGPRTGEYMYNHAIAALAMAEAYGMTKAVALRPSAQRGIDYLVSAQNPALGWRYTSMPGDNDTSCTGWAVMALKSALLAGLDVPRQTFAGARAWLDRVTDSSGLVGYTAMGQVDVFVPNKNEAWRSHPSMTAIGLLLRIYIDTDERDPMLVKSGKLIVADLPKWDAHRHEVDCYYWYYATLALYQFKDAPGGMPLWSEWNDHMKAALLPNQRTTKDGCADGSWDPEVDRWGYAGGRVYLTAVNAMTLEVYYRYEGVLAKAREAQADRPR